MPNIDPEMMKEAVKEALTEWLNKKLAEFGWFGIKTIAAGVLAFLVWTWFFTHGWKT